LFDQGYRERKTTSSTHHAQSSVSMVSKPVILPKLSYQKEIIRVITSPELLVSIGQDHLPNLLAENKHSQILPNSLPISDGYDYELGEGLSSV